MLDTRINTIIYQSQVYYSTLVNTLVDDKKLGNALDDKWRKADLILGYLEALNYVDRLTDTTDRTNVNYVLECLIKLCELNSYPVNSPLSIEGVPTILFGIPGADGRQGDTGADGATGLATDFIAGPSSINVLVDTFDISSAKAARWDYVVTENGGGSRAGSVIGHWTPTGSSTESTDLADDDLVATTDGIEFQVQFSGTSIFLIVVITSGTWNIVGTRYFIPNNGNGTGPISGLLSLGKVYIGNASNLAQEQFITGAISITPGGVSSINPGVIIDSNVSASAAIAVTKLAALTASKLVVTDGSGILTTTNTPTLTEIGYVGGVTSAIQTQLNTKLTDPTITAGDLIYRNGSNIISRLGVGTAGQILTITGGIPTWQNAAAGFVDPMTSIGDLIVRNAGNITTRLGIGSSGQVLTVSGGVASWQTPTPAGVTSVATTQPAAGLTISGGPITTTGTFTFALADDLAAVESLASTGIVRRTAPNTWSAGGLVLTTEGGTNINSYTTGDLLYASGANILSKRGIGSAGQVLTVSAGVPVWSGITAAGSNTQIQYNNAGVLGASSSLTFNGSAVNINGTPYSSNSIIPTSGNYTIILPNVTGTNGGILTLKAGSVTGGNGDGGIVSIEAGQKLGTGVPGYIVMYIDTGNDFLTFKQNGTTGNLIINAQHSSTSIGETLTIKAGTPTTGNINGGDITLTGGTASGTGRNGVIKISNIPTSSAGLPSGAIWSNAGVLNIVP